MRTALVLALTVGLLGPISVQAAAVSTTRVAQDQREPAVDARKPTDAERKAAIASIEAQLKAFKADDYTTAMKYQSSALKENFESTEAFRRAIKEGYPQFARYKSVSFGLATCNEKGDRLVIQATLTGEDNVTLRAIYLMLRENGEYKVDGVQGGARQRIQPKDEV